MINIGSTILILGCIYFDYTYGFNWWLVPFILLGLVTWAYIGFSDERKGLYKAQIQYYESRADYYKRKGE